MSLAQGDRPGERTPEILLFDLLATVVTWLSRAPAAYITSSIPVIGVSVGGFIGDTKVPRYYTITRFREKHE